MAVTVEQLEGLYLAYFGRPADADGLAFYLGNPDTDIWVVAKAFSESPESKALYGATFNSSVISAIYENLFNRAAEPAGLQYWSGEVSAGRLTAAGAAFAILLGAQNDDFATIQNKLAVCAAFTNEMDTARDKAAYSGAPAAATARSFISSVDSTQASLIAGLGLAPNEVGALAVSGSVSGLNQVVAQSPIASGATYTVAADRPNFLAANGIVDLGYAYLDGLASGASVEISGATGTGSNLSMSLATDTPSDFINLKINPYVLDDNNEFSSMQGGHSLGFYMPDVEHLNLHATATISPVPHPVVGWQPDHPYLAAILMAPDLQSLQITGDQALRLDISGNGLTVIDASGLVSAEGGGLYSFISNRYDLGFIYQAANATPALVVRGSQASANELLGSDWDNILIGGAKDDLLWGSYGADTLTGGGGNDRFRFVWSYDSDYVAGGAAPVDTITDFAANTSGRGIGGVPDAYGALAILGWLNGDVIDLTAYQKSTISVLVVSGAAAATTALQSIPATAHVDVGAVLDAATGLLYLDTNADGVVDTKIELTGVKTLTTAAFLLDGN